MTNKQGEPFGRYQLLERLGAGGMAEVFLAQARSVHGFEKLVAIKRILPHYTEDETFARMFADEARISAELRHPNICQVYDYGQVDKVAYLAMEYVDGRHLKEVLYKLRTKNQKLPIAIALYIVRSVCEALAYAHELVDKNGNPLGIIHRDISPPNVMVSADGQVKLIDFGIAKAAIRLERTLGGVIKGKFAYMSPEQMRGEPLDQRSDVFALGILAFELITGQTLFQADNPLSASEKVQNLEIPTPSSLNPAAPKVLDEIVLKALERAPSDRYLTSRALLERITQVVRDPTLAVDAQRVASWMAGAFPNDGPALVSAESRTTIVRGNPAPVDAVQTRPLRSNAANVEVPNVALPAAAEPAAPTKIDSSSSPENANTGFFPVHVYWVIGSAIAIWLAVVLLLL